MKRRYLYQIVVACLGIFAVLSLQGSPKIAQVLQTAGNPHNPISAVQAFYKAVERGDWLQARALTTGDYWSKLEKQGQLKTWQNLLQQDQSLEFTGFTVKQSKVEAKRAVIDGRPVWVSAQDTIPRSLQTITLEQGLGGWYISSIVSKESSANAELFYLYLSQGQWDKAKGLVQSDTWRSWENQGLITKIKSYRKNNPFVTATVKQAREQGNSAQVQLDLVWMLSNEFKTQTVVQLKRTGDMWLIQRIEGGWPK